jgi:WXG100 family type VII secretion target
MASEIIYRFDKMTDAAGKIDELAESYRNLGQQFIDKVNTETGGWEGDSKTKFSALVNGEVNQYLVKEVPAMLNGLAKLLRADAQQMEKADAQVAEGIPAGIGLTQ